MNGILWFKHSPPNGPSVDLISPILIKQWFHFSTPSQAPLLGSRSAAWLVSQHMQIWIKGGRTTRQRRVCWYPSQCEARGPSHHRWEKEIGGPSRPSAYYPEASFGAWQSHIGACMRAYTRACAHTCSSKPLHLPPIPRAVRLKMCLDSWKIKIPKPLQLPCHWLSLLPVQHVKEGMFSSLDLREIGVWNVTICPEPGGQSETENRSRSSLSSDLLQFAPFLQPDVVSTI